MGNSDDLLDRQAAWQRSRRDLSWAEKVRMAERARPATEAWRLERERTAKGRDGGAKEREPAGPLAPGGASPS